MLADIQEHGLRVGPQALELRQRLQDGPVIDIDLDERAGHYRPVKCSVG